MSIRNTPQQKLQKWFAKNMRDLPWRMPSPRNPYSVVVSEIMLQQTQVATVLRYWDRWMKTFPSFEALANAPVEKVLKAWEGMGYYSRARNLQKLAQAVVNDHNGQLPQEVEALLTLPGVGRYSCRSIASLAFDKPAACVDGNIVRVLSRLKGIDKQHKNAAAAQQDFQPLADDFLNKKHPGEHNEAMMELGATICTKANPQCAMCPLQEECWAYASGNPEALPRFEKVQTIAKQVDRIWVIDGKCILLQTGKAATGVLDGLYEIPSAENLGLKKLPAKPLLSKVRNITKYKITERIFKVDPTSIDISKHKHLHWVKLKDLESIPLSGPHAAWIKLLLEA